jgi:glycogen debranching enzyme
MTNNNPHREVLQVLHWGSIHQERSSPPDTMYALTGPSLYVLGDIDGGFRRRSNPYDLHAFGTPHPKDALADKLQGVWAQPVRGLSGYAYWVEQEGQRWDLTSAETFTQSFASVRFTYTTKNLNVVRQDFIHQGAPVLMTNITLCNTGEETLRLRLGFVARFGLEDAWFSLLAKRRNRGETLSIEDGRLIARAESAPDSWVAAAAGADAPETARLLDKKSGELVYQLQLEPGAEATLRFAISVTSTGGAEAVLRFVADALAESSAILTENEDHYRQMQARGPHLDSPDPALNTAFDLARANMRMLLADSYPLGTYFYAGLEIFPFWFSNDGAYSAPGLFASGFHEETLNHVRIGRDHLDEGRVPHQISPSGKVAFPGNAQETPLWVMSVWDAYRWTGSRAILEDCFPGAVQGLFEYVLGVIDADGDGYPSGPGMVEAQGMGEEKLDSAAYTWAALHALAKIATVLEEWDTVHKATARAEQIAARFDNDWWDEAAGSYAISLVGENNARYHVPHWAIVVPFEVGLADQRRAAPTFQTLRAKYLNRWGLKHTVGDDERVWTLPTATLSRAAYRYGDPALGYAMLRAITETLNTGSIGLLHELIPEGACIIQLWSAAALVRGIVEDLLGIEVNAGSHTLRITPQLPEGWETCALSGLAFGEHVVNVRIHAEGVQIHHQTGSMPLAVTVIMPSGAVQDALLQPGETRAL